MAFVHTRRQDFATIGFPLHVSDGTGGISEGELDGKIEPADPSAKREDINHVIASVPCGCALSA